MSLTSGKQILLASAAEGRPYTTAQRSVRFNSADSAYLSRTPASAGNRKTWTISLWVKRSKLGVLQSFTSSANDSVWLFDASDKLCFYDAGAYRRVSTQVFRDASAWYHLVLVVDTPNSTAQNRARAYVNGTEITTWDTNTTITQNRDTTWNDALAHQIGANNSTQYSDLYVALFHNIDGQALTPSSFGKTDTTTGQWIPLSYPGIYGTNGFFLDFLDNSAATAAALGKDSSGNGNNFTPNNIVVTNSTVTTYAINTQPASSTPYAGSTLTNTTWTGTATNDVGFMSNTVIPKTTTKTYIEIRHTSSGGGDPGPGVSSDTVNELGLAGVKAWWRGGSNGGIERGTVGTFSGTNTTWTTTDYLGIGMDPTANGGAGSITFYKNGVAAWTGGSGWTSYNMRFQWQNNGSGTDSGTVNYGASAFQYLPSGYVGLIASSVLSTTDSVRDNPVSIGSSTGVGGEASGNYCTLNPLAKTAATATLSNGNLETAGDRNSYGTIALPSSGKWYWEVTPTDGANPMIGVAAYYSLSSAAYGETSVFYYVNGNKYITGLGTAYGASYTLNDVIGVAVNIDSGTVTFYKNNVSQGAITFNAAGLFPSTTTGGGSASYRFNFGQQAFSYTAPSGFLPLVDTLLTAPTITKPNTVMDVATYTGNASTQTISGLAFSPDLVWTKSRANAYSHLLYDTVRGATNYLTSNNTDAEGTGATTLTAFNSDGFTLGSGENSNQSGGSVAWTWDAGSSNAPNDLGTIASTVRVNTSAGFSVVTYTGTGSNASVGHGLGVAPQFIIGKNRDSGAFAWRVYHTSIGATKTLYLNLINSATTDTDPWNNTGPSSTVVTLLGGASINRSGQRSVLYCWTPVVNYSAFGSYIGNGSSDGPFIYTGFRPAYVLIKGSTQGTSWNIVDNKRLGYNSDNYRLFAEATSAENATGILDFTANGFKIRNTGGDYNDNSQTYVYACFAESPFQYARAR